jgi:DNA-binding SARP family transcriptional activator
MMNERLEQLYIQAHDQYFSNEAAWEKFDPEKFAELIIRECMKMCDEVHRDYGMASDTARISKRYIKKHFGVEE